LQGGDLAAGQEAPTATPIGAEAAQPVGIGVGGENQVGLHALGRGRGAIHRLGHFRVRRLDDVGELAVGRHLFLDRRHAEALVDEHFHGRHGADAVQGREDNLDLVKARRLHHALMADKIHIGLVRRLIEEMHPAAAQGFGATPGP
jgi:hypothetical protein